MIADSVEVISKRWDKGLEDINSLIFKNGLTLRPIIKSGKAAGFNSNLSTQIRVKLKPNLIESKVEVTGKNRGFPPIYPSFSEYIARMVCGLDVKVSFEGFQEPKKTIHNGVVWDANTYNVLLNQISFGRTQKDDPIFNEYIEKNHHRLRVIRHEGRIAGIAALSTNIETITKFLGASAIGGLVTLNQETQEHFIGYLNYKPKSARRDAIEFDAPIEVIKDWAKEQVRILEKENITDYERYVVANNACYFCVDPISIARIAIIQNGAIEFVSYHRLAEIAKTVSVGIFKPKMHNFAETHHSITDVKDIVLIRPLMNGNSLSLKRDKNGIPSNPHSVIGCLYRAAEAIGCNPIWSIQETSHRSYFGEMELLVFSYHQA